MAILQNNLANISTSVGSIAGDCIFQDYDSSFDLAGAVDSIELTKTSTLTDIVAGIATAMPSAQNAGFITNDGAPTASAPDTDDQSTTLVVWDGLEKKFGRSIITGRSFGFTLAETTRNSAWELANGKTAIVENTNKARASKFVDKGQNATAQTVLIPCELETAFELIVIEKGMITQDGDFSENESEPRVLALTIDCQEGASLNEKLVRFRWNKADLPDAPTPPPAPQKAPAKNDAE